MKKYIYPLALAATALFATSCSDDETTSVVEQIPDSQKESIAFTASAETGTAPSTSSMTRAGFTGGAEFTSTNTYPTQIVARFSSTNKSDSKVHHTKTVLSASYDASAAGGAYMPSYSAVNFTAGNERFWDDAFGRGAQLSVYAVAVPNYTDVQNNSTTLYNLVKQGSTNVSTANPNWQNDTEDDAINSIAWQVSTTQTDDYSGTIAKEDLCYSHNIQSATDAAGSLNYGKGKDGVRIWGKHEGHQDANGYPVYDWASDATDHYPYLDNGRMEFRLTNTASGAPTDGPGHFDKGHMIFRHALTRVTINLKKSTADGFKDDKSDFVLTSDLITLLNMHYKGTLNIKNGTWSAYTEGTGGNNADIKMASKTATSENDYTNFAQVIPGYVLDGSSSTNVVKFTISDNTYFITQKQLYNALNTDSNKSTSDINGNKLVTVTDNKITLEQGKNYVFTVTVKKQGIQSITASLVPWVEVSGEATATNDYVKISLHDKTNVACGHFDLYRLNDDQTNIYAPTTGPTTGETWNQNYNWYGNKGTAKEQNYKDKATLTETSSIWKTNWFWENNKSFYHFRSVNTGLTIQEDNTANKDYFNIYGGPIQDYDEAHSDISTAQNESGKVNDFHWGAPFKTTATFTYDPTYGWSAAQDKDGQIYPAIGSTSQTINMIEHHMMSNIHIVLKTVKDETNTTGNMLGAGAVNLKTSTVKLTNFANEGTVEMGRGLVTPSTMLSEQVITAPSESDFYKTSGDYTETKPYGYRVVPQALYRTETPSTETDLTKFIGLTIVTPDNNQYYVIKNLSEITANSITNQGNKTELTANGKILRWYPGYDYTYIITISKKGIESITCTIVDWVKVTGENIDIDLES